MPISINHEDNQQIVMHISGTLLRSEFSASQAMLGQYIADGAHPRLLVILEAFTGWEADVDWSDLGFMLGPGSAIAKIAIIGHPRWEVEALAFTGAGLRQTPVAYFANERAAEARAWLQA